MKVLPMLHVTRNGCLVRTRELEKDRAVLEVEAEIFNASVETGRAGVKARIFDPSGALVGEAETTISVLPQRSAAVDLTVEIGKPELWGPEHPVRYRAELEISGKDESDHYTQNFGIRTAVYTREGLVLNGSPVELKGVCVHQDFAGVGIAMPDDILRYRLQRIKDMGGNAYRSAHHAAAGRLLDLCDEMGILVLNEIRHFDMAQESMTDFEDMIKSSRNHPCVYMYCLENEEFAELILQGKRILKRLIEVGKLYDPDRPFTTATQFGRGDMEYQLIADVAGYNYDSGEARELLDAYPEVCVMATEDASFVSTRGVYEDSPEQGWCDCYEGESYYAKLMRKSGIDPGTMGGALAGMKLTNVFANNRVKTPELGGMFVWTAFDYRGETFPWNWPAVVSGYGAMDFCSFEKDVFYYWKSIWTQEPMVHVLPHWTWDGREGETFLFEAYSNCDEIELFVNGVSRGRKAHERGTISRWELCYEPGELRAVAYRNGEQAAEEIHHTAGEADHIELCCVYDGECQKLFQARILDKDGNLCPHSCVPLTFTAEGGSILGVGNGDPACHEPDVSNTRTSFNGLALCIVDKTQDKVSLDAVSEGLGTGKICR